MNARTEPAPAGSDATARPPHVIARPPLVRELLLVAGLFLVYKFGRQLATGHTSLRWPHRAATTAGRARGTLVPAQGRSEEQALAGAGR
ncbi:hypothetical protein GCM10011428_26420 [Streptomyces violaceus]